MKKAYFDIHPAVLARLLGIPKDSRIIGVKTVYDIAGFRLRFTVESPEFTAQHADRVLTPLVTRDWRDGYSKPATFDWFWSGDTGATKPTNPPKRR